MTDTLATLKNINLLPWREEYKEFQRKQFIFFLGFAAAMSVFLIVGLHLFFMNRTDNQYARNDYLKQEIAKIDKQITEIEGLQKERQLLLARMNVIQRLQENRPNAVKIFDGIAKTVPDGLYFTNVTRVKSKLNIQGKAESNIRVSKFMRNIEASAWLTNPVLSVIAVEDEQDKNKNQAQTTMKLSEQDLMFNLDAQQTFKEE